MNENELQRIFENEGNGFGFNEVKAQFSPEKDLKVKWQRCSDWIHFCVSDYLKDVPSEIMASVAHTIMSRIRGDMSLPYPESTVGYLSSEEFLRRNQPIYVARHGYDNSDESVSKIESSVKRLCDRGLLQPLDGVYLCWSNASQEYVGKSSVLMRAVAINSRLNGPLVQDDLLDYCVYSQMLLLNNGFTGGTPDRDRYLEVLAEYPESEEMDKLLEQMGLHV